IGAVWHDDAILDRCARPFRCRCRPFSTGRPAPFSPSPAPDALSRPGRPAQSGETAMDKPPLERFPFHLGLGATAVPEPEFTGADWYARYGERHADDGAEGRLVQMYSFSESWTTWEMHPAGEEAVICTAGEMTLIQELPD